MGTFSFWAAVRKISGSGLLFATSSPQTEAVMKKVTEKIRFYLQNRANGMIETEAVIFSNEHGFLGKTEGADRLLDEIKADEKR